MNEKAQWGLGIFGFATVCQIVYVWLSPTFNLLVGLLFLGVQFDE